MRVTMAEDIRDYHLRFNGEGNIVFLKGTVGWWNGQTTQEGVPLVFVKGGTYPICKSYITELGDHHAERHARQSDYRHHRESPVG